MTTDPWGRDEPPALSGGDLPPLPPVLAEIVAAFESGDVLPVADGTGLERPGPRDLPEVQRLTADGWLPLGEMPPGDEDVLLPAVWPPQHRCWVPDRMPAFSVVTYGEGQTFLEPERRNPVHQQWETARLARSVGLPPPPAGRCWLLRSPWPGMRAASLLLAIRQTREDEQLGWDAAALMRAAQRVLGGTEEQAWARWHGPQADAARAWREAGVNGRDGQALPVDPDPWVRLGLGPGQVARLARPLTEGGAGLTDGDALRWCEGVSFGGAVMDDLVDKVVAWRRAGLPEDAPVGRLATVFHERQPDEVARWLEAGFTVREVALWGADDLARASRWRAAGFDSRTARDLVMADPQLTTEEARAFDEAGIAPKARERWVAAGFPADAARAWTDLDVVAAEARVWRSLGLTPADAVAQRDAGTAGPLPAGFEGGWFAYGPDRDDLNFGVTDPPGTRGAVAQEATLMGELPGP